MTSENRHNSGIGASAIVANENNWLYAQIDAIARYACGPDGREEDIGALCDLCRKLQQANDRIKQEIGRRMDCGQTAGVSRWS